MSSKLKLGESGRTDRAVLGHLVTIGTYLNRDSWGDDLQRINGVGPGWESRLRDHGITTFDQVVKMDRETKASLNRYEGVDPPINAWIKSAKTLKSLPAPDADAYLEKVKALSNHFDSNGDVAITHPSASGPATREWDNIFIAPKNDARSQKLEAALRGLVDAAGGVARVPNLTTGQVAVLEATANLLGARRKIDDDMLPRLNRVLKTADITLERISVTGEEFDIEDPSANPYGSIPAENRYGSLPGENPDDGSYESFGPAPQYGDQTYSRLAKPGYIAPEPSHSSEGALQAGGGGARVDGVGYQDAQPHDTQQATPGEDLPDEEPLREDEAPAEEEPAGEPETETEAPAEEEL